MDNGKTKKSNSLRGSKKDVHIWMPIAVYEAFKKEAAKDDRSVTSYINMVLKNHTQQKEIKDA